MLKVSVSSPAPGCDCASDALSVTGGMLKLAAVGPLSRNACDTLAMPTHAAPPSRLALRITCASRLPAEVAGVPAMPAGSGGIAVHSYTGAMLRLPTAQQHDAEGTHDSLRAGGRAAEEQAREARAETEQNNQILRLSSHRAALSVGLPLARCRSHSPCVLRLCL